MKRPGRRTARHRSSSCPTAHGDVPGWGCVLAVLLLTIILFVGNGACSALFDGDDDAPSETTEPSSG